MSDGIELYHPSYEKIDDLTNEELQLILVAWEDIKRSAEGELARASTLPVEAQELLLQKLAMARGAIKIAERIIVTISKMRRRLGESTWVDPEKRERLLEQMGMRSVPKQPVAMTVASMLAPTTPQGMN